MRGQRTTILQAANGSYLSQRKGMSTEPNRGRPMTMRECMEAEESKEQSTEPAPGYCPHCKQYTIAEPLPADTERQDRIMWLADTYANRAVRVMAGDRPIDVDRYRDDLEREVRKS
jgi:hypothetical protein